MRLDRDKTAHKALHGGIKAREKYWQSNTSPGFFVVLIIRRNYERKKHGMDTACCIRAYGDSLGIYDEAQPWVYGALAERDNHSDTNNKLLLAKAVNTLGIGLSYAVFTGIGVVGTTFISIFVLKEGASLLKMLSLGVLIIGILGLKLCDKEGEAK